MGRQNNNHCKPSRGRSKTVYDEDGNEDDSANQCSSSMSKLKPRTSIKEDTSILESCLEQLFEKRGSTRENALSSIVDRFTNNVQHRFISNKCITLLHRCLNSIKKGSTREICLASHVIGLLSITAGCTNDLSHEILEDSVPVVSQALQSASEPSKLASLLECLAIITFVGGSNLEETERSMQLMWQFIPPKSGSPAVASEHTSQVMTTAISAWSFLLATLDSWSINPKIWREAMSHFSNLLYNDDLPLHMAAGEALGLIFEIGSLQNFFNKTINASGTSACEECERHVTIETLKDTVLDQVRTLSLKSGGDDATEKDLVKAHRTLFHDVLRIIQGDYSPENRIKIGKDFLKISTWSQLVQVNFLKHFLGGGFVRHAQENELLHDFLEFTPKRIKQLGNKQYISSDEKVAIRYVYQPEIRNGDAIAQRKANSSNSVLNKAKTQIMNKQRMLSQAKNDGYYSANFANEDA